MDCAGICAGLSTVDECGVCDDDPSNDCVEDCAGVWGGSALVDDCGYCTGGDTGLIPNFADAGCGCDEPAPELYFPDEDSDNFGFGSGNLFCDDLIPDGWVHNSGDCDDTNMSVNPGMQEICDWIDNNCDETIDEGCIPGDLTADSVVDVADLVLLVQFALGDAAPDEYENWAGDLNHDSIINVVDIVYMVSIILSD